MNALPPREAYRLWAPTYAAETAISFLDEELTEQLLPPLPGKRLLDAGCGVGRRLVGERHGESVGIDASPEMLSAGGKTRVAAADIRALPFAASEFDRVWCRLVLGHLRDPVPAYREMARVCRRQGFLLVSDFHADAVAAGHRRTFRDTNGALHEVEHHVHDAARHVAAASDGGFALIAQRNGVVGRAVEQFYVRAGREAVYEKDARLAVIAAFLFRRND